MRIHTLHVDGFGHFADREFGPFAAPVTVIEGLNEAGKSTLLAFIRTILFGWPQKRTEYYPPLRGGRHGGSIELAAATGDSYRVERWEDSHGAHMLLTLPDGTQTRDEAALQRLLGNTSKSTFEEVFAFDADVLRGLSGDANSEIFEAGMGARALPRVLAAIEKQRTALFKKGGSSQKVSGLLAELRAVKDELATVEGEAADYGRLTQRLDELKDELAIAESVLAAVVTRQGEHAPLLKGWDAWVESRQLRATLAGMPVRAGFPADGVARLDAAEAAATRATTDFDEAERALDRWQAEADLPIKDAPLLAESAAILELRDRRSSYTDSAETLPKRVAERDAAEAKRNAALRELGPGWDSTRVQAFDTSLQVQDEVQAHRAAIDAAARASDAAEAEEDRTATALALATTAHEQQQAKVDAVPRPALDRAALRERRQAIRDCRSLAAEHERAASDLATAVAHAETLASTTPRRNGRTRAVALRAMAVTGIGLAMLVALAIGANASVAGAIITTAVEVMLAAALVWAWRAAGNTGAASLEASVGETHLDAARAREQQALAAVTAAAHQLGLGVPSPAGLDAIEARLETTDEAVAAYDALLQALETTAAAHQAAGKSHTAATDSLESAVSARDAAFARWEAWLRAHELNESLRPELVAVLIGKVENACTLAATLVEKQHRIDSITDDIRRYESGLAVLCGRLGIAAETDTAAAVIAQVAQLSTRRDAAEKAAEARERARSEVARASEQVARQSAAAETAQARVTSLLALAGVDDGEAFRALAALLEQRRELEARLSKCTTELTTLSGPADALARFEAALAATTRPEIEARAAELATSLDAAQQRRDEIRDERSRCEAHLARLTGGEHTSELLARRETLEAELRAVASEWAALTVAKEVLERARRRWEEERQPAVVRDASDLFAAITAQRYSRIVPQLDSDSLKVVEAESGRQKEAVRLSRGTREQLYLALRFGLIRQFGERATSLPVIVDEILINFDAERGQRVAEAFGQLASTNQVIVFTCHEWVAALFEQAAACEVTSLGDRTVAAAPVLSPRLFAETR